MDELNSGFEFNVDEAQLPPSSSTFGGTSNHHAKRTLAARPARAELRVLSQPSGLPLDPTNFFYDDSEGLGVTVYMIDTGAEMRHDVSDPYMHLSAALSRSFSVSYNSHKSISSIRISAMC